jgi:hypothetical protein
MTHHRNPAQDDAIRRIASVDQCQPRPAEPPPPEPPIDYTAKDYASFRQALIDLIPQLASGWAERHEADVGIALLELLAYVGDQLSYYQDAVANEAFLETARQRVSVRRHANLIDYRMHSGASARAFVHFRVGTLGGTLPRGTKVLSRIEAPLGYIVLSRDDAVIPRSLVDQALNAAALVFETLADIRLHPDLNKIALRPWERGQDRLPCGATFAALAGDLAFDPDVDEPESWKLKPGDFLLFEGAAEPQAARWDDAGSFCQIVRLTEVQTGRAGSDSGGGPQALTWVAWDEADALEFSLRLYATAPNGSGASSASVARGNLVLADHGHTLTGPEWHPSDPSEPAVFGGDRAYRLRLQGGSLAFRLPLKAGASARSLLSEADPREARAQVSLTVGDRADALEGWDPAPDMIGSGPASMDFVVETEDDGRASIRFGDGEFGAALQEGSRVGVTYRVGVGKRGNVGAEGLAHIVEPDSGTLPYVERVRNPLPAWGGEDPEPAQRAKELAPVAFRAGRLRAVTAEDYALVAEEHPEVYRARASFRWTGSWRTVFISIDPRGRKGVPPELRRRVQDWVARGALAGYDLEIRPPLYVPVEIDLEVWLDPEYHRSDVERALRAALGDRLRPDGSSGFFYPDNFTFDQPLYLSQLYEEVEAVKGVGSAIVTRFKRLLETPANALEQGYIPVDPLEIIRMDTLEIIRMDNDPALPENGRMRLKVKEADERRI